MKKVLTIVLSVAMVICLMPAMAFAADATTTADNTTKATGLAQFSDADSITNKEAVSVLTGLHIINGMGDGTFQPKGDVTRAQTATMISILVRGGDTSSLKAPSQDPFTDVAKDNWAAPYVAYGAQQGYINGMGDGTYAPDNNVTTAQLATILEQILGYSKADVAYQWPENAMAFAQTSGLLNNISKGANDNLDREEAAQMIYNALLSDDVVKTTVTGNADKSKYGSVASTVEKDYRSLPENVEEGSDLDPRDDIEQLVEKLFPKATLTEENVDDFGRTATVWKNGRDEITDEVIATPVLTYTSAQKASDLKADLKGYSTKDVTVVENGTESTVTLDAETLADKTGNGVLVELYANEKDNKITKAVVIDYDLGTVQSVNAQTGLITLKDRKTIAKEASFYSAIASVAKGDKILYATGVDADGKDVIGDAYLPTKVTGPVTATTKDAEGATETATVNGTKYTAAGTFAGTINVDATNDQVLYLDKYNYIKGSEEADNAVVSKWVLVKAVYTTTDKYGLNKTTYVQGVDDSGAILDEMKVSADNTAKLSPNRIYAFEEKSNGYVFSETGSNSSKHQGADAAKATATTLKDANGNTYFVSTSVKTVDVSGEGSTLKVASTDGLKALNEGEYKFIVKKSGDNDLVTTVFRLKDASESTVVYITDVTGEQAYADKDGKTQTGSVVTYYDAADANAKTMIVTGKNINTPAFYSISANGEAFDATSKDVAQGKKGTISKAYNKTIVIGNATLPISNDAAVRDLRDANAIAASTNSNNVQKITTVDELVDAVASNNIKVTYVTNDDTSAPAITQIYIKSLSAKPDTNK